MKSPGTLLLVAGLIALYGGAAFAEGLEAGTVAPNIIGRTTTGELFKLHSFNGKLKVVNFWWVRCVPCKTEMPELAALEKKYPGAKVAAIHIAPEDEVEIEKFLGDIPGHPKTIVKSARKVMEAYNFTGLPHTVVLDENNKVLKTLAGYTPENMAAIERILSDGR